VPVFATLYQGGNSLTEGFLFYLFNNAFSVAEGYIAVNDELERMWSWPNLRHYPSICLEGLRKT
jgi:hypothetical protein